MRVQRLWSFGLSLQVPFLLAMEFSESLAKADAKTNSHTASMHAYASEQQSCSPYDFCHESMGNLDA